MRLTYRIDILIVVGTRASSPIVQNSDSRIDVG
jgi:hypothetical protein